MPTLKEIKGRIASVQSTLKITSAMKLVSSAKLRKAQAAIESMRPYQEKLSAMLNLAAGEISPRASLGRNDSADASFGRNDNVTVIPGPDRESHPTSTIIIAMASNSSLCGGFNAQVIAKTREVLRERPGARVIAIGRKMADAMRKAGALSFQAMPLSIPAVPLSFPAPTGNLTQEALSALSDHPSYAPVSAMVDTLMNDPSVGEVLLVYNHFVSTGKQVPVVETLFEISSVIPSAVEESYPDIILEPSRKELMEALYPKAVKIKLYAALLDSAAAEHAARTVAMQTATDNGEDLLQELTLQYNKGRQQKITNEILDLAGGSQN